MPAALVMAATIGSELLVAAVRRSLTSRSLSDMASSLRSRPESSEYAPFYHRYVASVPEGDVVKMRTPQGIDDIEVIEVKYV